MNAITFCVVLFAELCSIAGQIFFKHAMNQTHGGASGKFVPILLAGVAAMSLNFFLWLGLLSKFQLSFLYPFDGLGRVVLVVAAYFFLKEKMTPALWVGVLLISAGILLVSAS
ncbi:MAG: EamA family transporter [Verrucomicrobiota bacterium]|nr:EamA family transporter [Verrucomicrobiota bacterium]